MVFGYQGRVLQLPLVRQHEGGCMKRRLDPNKTYIGPAIGPYRDPERVPMILLAVGLMIVFIVFLVWAIS